MAAVKERKLSAKQLKLVAALEKQGGRIEPDNGSEFIPPAVLAKKLGMKPSKGSNFTTFLRYAERSGIITREVQGRRTRSITLLDGGTYVRPAANGKRSPRPSTTAPAPTPTRRRSSLKTPLPEITGQVEVSLVSVERDGSVHLGIRNDEGTWMVALESFAPAPVEESTE